MNRRIRNSGRARAAAFGALVFLVGAAACDDGFVQPAPPLHEPEQQAVTAFQQQQNRDALVALYDSTNGPNWKRNDNWLSDAPVDEWYGVVTDSLGRVRWLTLWDNGLKGPIVRELGNLTALEVLGIGDNELTGEVPAELGSATQFVGLWIDDNLLTGIIPSTFLDLSHLRVLDFSGNDGICMPGTTSFEECGLGVTGVGAGMLGR